MNKEIAALFLAGMVFWACEDEGVKPPQSEDKVTDAGWEYRYVHLPDKDNGWKVVIAADSPWNFEDHNPWAADIAPMMLFYSGYDDVTPADKAAMVEDWYSNAVIYQTPTQVMAEIYVEKGEEEEFMRMVQAMFENPTLDEDYFEETKLQIAENIREAEKQKNSGYIADKVIAYANFEQDGNIISTYDQDIEALEALSLEDAQEWIDHVYGLSGFMIGMAGADDPEALTPYLDQVLAPLSQSDEGVDVPEILPPKERRSIAMELEDMEKALFISAAPWPRVNSLEEFVPLMFAVNVLNGSHTKTRLASIREDLRASYGFQSNFYSVDINTYFLNIFGETDPEAQLDVQKAVQEIKGSMRTQKFTEDEFEAARSAEMTNFNESYRDENYMALVMELSLNPDFGGDWQDEYRLYETAQLDEIWGVVQKNFPQESDWTDLIITNDASDLEVDCVIQDWRQVEDCF